jgi:hypothetical protein
MGKTDPCAVTELTLPQQMPGRTLAEFFAGLEAQIGLSNKNPDVDTARIDDDDKTEFQRALDRTAHRNFNDPCSWCSSVPSVGCFAERVQ